MSCMTNNLIERKDQMNHDKPEEGGGPQREDRRSNLNPETELDEEVIRL